MEKTKKNSTVFEKKGEEKNGQSDEDVLKRRAGRFPNGFGR